jgi:hypothetical protein
MFLDPTRLEIQFKERRGEESLSFSLASQYIRL